MANKESFYVDADQLSEVIRNIPLFSFYVNETSSYAGNNSIDTVIEEKINSAVHNLASSLMSHHYRLMAEIANAIELSKKPYTQCMLCCSNGQKTIDDLE